MATIEMKRRKRKNPNGYGCVRQDKTSGRWVASVTTGYDNKGKQKFKNFSSKTQQEVIKKLDKFKDQMNKGLCLEHTQITLENWLDTWYNNLVVGKVGIKTRCDYECSIRCHIKPRLGRMKLSQLKNIHIQQFYNDLLKSGNLREKGKGLSPKSVRNVHIALHRALEQAVNNDLIIKNPARGITLEKSDKSTREALTEDEEKALIKNCFDHPWGMAVFIALFTGMRIGEILGLQWQDIDFEKNSISINKQVGRIKNFDEDVKTKTLLCLRNGTKTKKSTRTIKLAPVIMEKLKKYKTAQDENKKKWKEAYNDLNMVFCREDGNLADPKTVSTFYHDTLGKAGIAKKTFHELRHTFATRAVENTSNVKTVSSILGHANITTTLNIYTHDSQELQQETIQNMADKLLSA